MGLEQDGNEVYYLLLKIMFYVSVVWFNGNKNNKNNYWHLNK
jgi:hypothetical protein